MCCTRITWTQPLLRASHQGVVSKYRSYLGSCSSKQSEDFWALHRTTLVQTTSQASQSTACSPRHSLMLLGWGSTQFQKVYSFALSHLVHVTSVVSVSNPSPSQNAILKNIWFNARGVRRTLLHTDRHLNNKKSEKHGLLGKLSPFQAAQRASILKVSQCYSPSPDF